MINKHAREIVPIFIVRNKNTCFWRISQHPAKILRLFRCSHDTKERTQTHIIHETLNLSFARRRAHTNTHAHTEKSQMRVKRRQTESTIFACFQIIVAKMRPAKGYASEGCNNNNHPQCPLHHSSSLTPQQQSDKSVNHSKKKINYTEKKVRTNLMRTTWWLDCKCGIHIKE